MRERASPTQAGEWYSTSVLPHLHVGKQGSAGGRGDGSGVAGLTSTTESTRNAFPEMPC